MDSGKKSRIVGFTYDLKSDYTIGPGDPPDKLAEFDIPETVDLIAKAIEDNGHRVVRLGNVFKLLSLGGKPQVDIVFNIAEGLSGRNRESQIPAILEAMDLPFVGSDALTMGLTLDKLLAKKIFISEGVPTPKFFQAKNPDDLKGLKLRFPLFIKPQLEGSSKGLDEGSVVRNAQELKARVDWLVRTYKQPALIEEFISGREFSVPIIGNAPSVDFYDPVQVKIKGKLELGDLFYAYAHITSTELEYVCPAQISKKLSERICKASLAAYNAVGCLDFGRVDLRVNEKEEIFVLEVNPLPSLCSDDIFAVVAQYRKIDFSQMIGNILNAAFKRYNLNSN